MAKFKIELGIDGESQRGSFQNGTLQASEDHQIDYTIQTFVKVPKDVAQQGEKVVAAHIEAALTRGDAEYDIQIGPGENREED